MEPIYRKAYLDLERAEERLKFYTIDESKLSAESRHGLPITESCKPLFVVFKNKAPIAKVLGAQGPELETAVFDNVFEVPKDEES